MSSASADIAAAAGRHTYWCHECDMSVTLVSPSPQLSSSSSSSTPQSSLLCPHCLTDFLEHMDFTIPTSSSSISIPSAASPPDSDPSSFVVDDPLPPASDDNYLLNSPQFLRLFQQLADSSDSDFPAPVPLNAFTPIKASVAAIPTVVISSAILELDPVLICAICKDHFVLEDEAKQLPCSHLYHPDCILPWLSNHDSCPLCRFKLPSDDPSDHVSCRGATMALRARDLMHQEDSYGLRTTLRHIARRHSSIFTEAIQVDSSQSPTQLGEAEMGTGEQTGSVETVSSVATEGGIIIVNSSGDENGVVGIDGPRNEDVPTVV
ncbi:E3 ubiquitin-protein ligase RING1-like [Momordica charantia]|uniref:RING-type E3 ubiquitin transferase n=1 Tax=Momordica charantia TaxID=3673 RepID=A0A6J1D1P8_MOMCH|nr:E3 ubiquitin-protein ligase RING1-like [Momordica charantia]